MYPPTVLVASRIRVSAKYIQGPLRHFCKSLKMWTKFRISTTILFDYTWYSYILWCGLNVFIYIMLTKFDSGYFCHFCYFFFFFGLFLGGKNFLFMLHVVIDLYIIAPWINIVLIPFLWNRPFCWRQVSSPLDSYTACTIALQSLSWWSSCRLCQWWHWAIGWEPKHTWQPF